MVPRKTRLHFYDVPFVAKVVVVLHAGCNMSVRFVTWCCLQGGAVRLPSEEWWTEGGLAGRI